MHNYFTEEKDSMDNQGRDKNPKVKRLVVINESIGRMIEWSQRIEQ